MKKIIYALCIFMVLGLAACNKDVETRDSIASSKTDKEKKAQDEKTESGKETTGDKEEKPAPKPKNPTVAGKVDLENTDNYWIELNGKRIEYGDGISSVLALGYTSEEAEELISPDYTETIDIDWDGSYCGMVEVLNDSGKERPAAQCKFSGIIMSEPDEEGVKLSIIGGITHGSSSEDVVAVFGVSDDLYESESGNYQSMSYTVKDGSKGFSFSCYDGKVDTIHIYVY